MKITNLFITVATVSLLLSGCFDSSFETHMRKGKDALLNNNYEEAIESFDTALIEEPTNKDAIALMKRAKEGKDNKEKNNKINEFILETKDIHEELKLLGDGIDIDKTSYDEASSKLDKLKPINEKLEQLSLKWSDNELVSAAFQQLQSASSDLESGFDGIIEIINQPEEILDTDINGEVSRFAQVRSRRGSTITSFINFKNEIDSYTKEINKLKENNQ